MSKSGSWINNHLFTYTPYSGNASERRQSYGEEMTHVIGILGAKVEKWPCRQQFPGTRFGENSYR